MNPKHSSISQRSFSQSISLSQSYIARYNIITHHILSILLSTRHQRQHNDRPTASFYEINHSDRLTESLYEINKQHTSLAKRLSILHNHSIRFPFPFSCFIFLTFVGIMPYYTSRSFRFSYKFFLAFLPLGRETGARQGVSFP